MNNETFNGSCFCGDVKYLLKARPMFIHCCHCTDCQCQTGSAFAINGIIEAENIELLQGSPNAISMKTDSGSPHDIFRCPACQTAVWSDYGRRGWLLFVRMSTLDKASDFVPDVHIYTRTKLPWITLPESAKAFAEYYSSTSEWPEESLARRENARRKAATLPPAT